jgi:hypothetical protein
MLCELCFQSWPIDQLCFSFCILKSCKVFDWICLFHSLFNLWTTYVMTLNILQFCCRWVEQFFAASSCQ